MFLHQIFYQGLKARISSWPTLVLADLFDILLPMLNIYQEFVRNHQYSLQILAHCKQNRDFDKLLKHYEAKPDCEERTLETFLTYPMFQIPRYILTLHELLAHTPHEHVERNSLDYAKSKLEELSSVNVSKPVTTGGLEEVLVVRPSCAHSSSQPGAGSGSGGRARSWVCSLLFLLPNRLYLTLNPAVAAQKLFLTHDSVPFILLSGSHRQEAIRIMHDEVSETENIRKNLAIERMIIEGCEILLDTSQTFVRQGGPRQQKGGDAQGHQQSVWLPHAKTCQCSPCDLLSPEPALPVSWLPPGCARHSVRLKYSHIPYAGFWGHSENSLSPALQKPIQRERVTRGQTQEHEPGGSPQCRKQSGGLGQDRESHEGFPKYKQELTGKQEFTGKTVKEGLFRTKSDTRANLTYTTCEAEEGDSGKRAGWEVCQSQTTGGPRVPESWGQ
ncbi:Ras protein-specific guanine nucleotide-releasing factor [Saguinus oedipus]|uniref:Ras protein-specific guanine nucleotide-releasing factor n=1 Tax=Saguinus oedipus TaxID=9490 RepID=A0ABQ9VG70_SAGOE|nr:Ras protein-specific guanine nucleotide-releasing factor [Saguinus oedipus]